MKKISLLFLFSLGMVSGVYSQSVKEIVAQNIKARGGKELLSKLKSYEMTLEAETPMGPIELKQYALNETGWRQEMQIMGQTTYTMVCKEGVYVLAPMSGSTSPTKLDPEKALSFNDKLNINGELYGYEEKGLAIDYSGEEDVEGDMCHILSIHKGGGDPKMVYISKTSGHLVKEKTSIMGPEGPMDLIMNYSNFKPTKEGFVFPMSVSNNMGTAKVKSIKVNQELAPKLFDANSKN